MKKKFMRAIAGVLTLAMVVGNIGVTRQAKAEEETTTESENVEATDGWEEDELEISYKITGSWDKHYNVDVTLKNVTDERIDSWEVDIPANYEIENIWNAKVVDKYDGAYTIHHVDYNQDIEAESAVTFGMTIKGEEEPEFPEHVNTNGAWCEVNEDNYKVKLKKHG